MTSSGKDVPKREAQVCIEIADGTVVSAQRIRTTRERFTAVFGGQPRARLLREASTQSALRLPSGHQDKLASVARSSATTHA